MYNTHPEHTPHTPHKVQTGVAFLVVARMFAPSVGAMSNGAHASASSGGTAWRRRQRLLRAFRRYVLWHSKMEIAAALHHASGMRASAPRVVGSLPPAEEFSLPVFYQVYQEQSVAGGSTENIVESPVVQEQVVVQAIPRVDGSLPPCEVFAAPVFDRVHQEPRAAGEITEKKVEFPVVPEQVIVQAIPHVVGSPPPVDKFTQPVYNLVHQEQSSAGETTENIAIIPVVQEQVIVQATPCVVDSLPPGAEFTGPVYDKVHQEHFSAGETTANIANIPVVQEQVLVQAIPRFVGSLPPVEEFTAYVARRPSPLVEVRPSVRAQRHIVEDLGELAPLVQILDLPVPQKVDYVMDALRLLDRPLAEQAISVPKFSCSPCPSRSRVLEPQSAEQLVDVPTVLTPTRIAVRVAEQIVDTSVPRGRARGSLPEQSSAAHRPAQSSRRRFTGRIWHMPAAGLYGYIESDSAKAAYAFVGDVPFFLAGSCRLGDHVTFAVGRGADGLEAYDLKVVGRG